MRLPPALKVVEEHTFGECGKLRTVEFPAGLEKICVGAFVKSGIENLVLPAALRTIAQGAFYKCEGLRAVKLNEGLEVLGTNEYSKYGDMYCGVFQRSAVEEVALPSTLKKIEYSAFEECKNLKNIRLPDRLECIGKWCFHETRLLTIRVPKKGVEAVPNSFSDCPAESCFTFFSGKIYPRDK